ncbi:peptide chain release factor 1 [Crenalkalicoccus roseus]|uniref:peptide chain release factor 1 n=1 Tax=Crenalkalicoccus roseus TaxID=1485588 RepID=UPI0010805243|nr:peptide chain release factor 1 [Crenalkalicoccus roseus]
MTEREFEAKLAELDRLLNDPEVRLDPDRVWSLLAELNARTVPAATPRAAR